MRLPHFRFFSKDVAGWLQISSSELLIATSNLSGWSQVTVFREINLVITPEKGRDKFPYISSEVFQKHQKTAKCINMHQNVLPLKLLLCWSSIGSNMFQWLSNNTIMPTPKSTIFPLPQPPTRLQPSQCPRSKVSHPTGANPVHLRRSKYRPARQHHRPLLRQGWCHGWAPCHWRSPSEIGCWK